MLLAINKKIITRTITKCFFYICINESQVTLVICEILPEKKFSWPEFPQYESRSQFSYMFLYWMNGISQPWDSIEIQEMETLVGKSPACQKGDILKVETILFPGRLVSLSWPYSLPDVWEY